MIVVIDRTAAIAKQAAKAAGSLATATGAAGGSSSSKEVSAAIGRLLEKVPKLLLGKAALRIGTNQATNQ